MFPSLVMALNLSRKVLFYNFVLTSARNLSLLNQFTYCTWKFSLHSFRKWHGLWESEPPFMRYQREKKDDKRCCLISPETVSHSIMNKYHFPKEIKVQKETFRMHIYMNLFEIRFECMLICHIWVSGWIYTL